MAANTTSQNLRDALRQLDGDSYQTIREAYYKAVEGLQVLAETLERAAGSSECDPLLVEHVIACSALTAINISGLGRVL